MFGLSIFGKENFSVCAFVCKKLLRKNREIDDVSKGDNMQFR